MNKQIMLIDSKGAIKIADTFHDNWIPPVILVVPHDRKINITIDHDKPFDIIPDTDRYIRNGQSKHYYIYEQED